MKLPRLNLPKAHVEYPDRWKAGCPLENFYGVPEDSDRTIVRNEGSEESHVVTLTKMIDSTLYGSCTCKGFSYNPGPCRHLCATYRAWADGLVELPRYEPTAIIAEPINPDTRRAEGVI